MSAESVCRTELWRLLRSQQKRMHDNAETRAFSSFDPGMPWGCAIAASTFDNEFWPRYFDRKALRALAGGKRGAPIHELPQPLSHAPEGGRPPKVPKITRRQQAWEDNSTRRPYGRS